MLHDRVDLQPTKNQDKSSSTRSQQPLAIPAIFFPPQFQVLGTLSDNMTPRASRLDVCA